MQLAFQRTFDRLQEPHKKAMSGLSPSQMMLSPAAIEVIVQAILMCSPCRYSYHQADQSLCP